MKLTHKNLIQFPLHTASEPNLEPRPVSTASMTMLAVAACLPVAFWLGHAFLQRVHLF